ncbi:MAG TPA: EF-hand domain-containing protein [Candidatus Aquabacterium excrementipullorum]|nr:EF-hand domain-containing protein [Candidatus Aquabacterium excrementipullorum]
MTSITSWSSITYYTPPARPDKREKPDFSTLDQDGSGGLDESELTAMLEKGPKGASSTASGTSSATSSSSDVSELFSTLDTDGDGSISESELDEGMKPPERAAEEGGWAGMQMDTQSFATMMMQGPPPPPPPSLSELDGDDDGTITAEEFGVSSTSSGDDDDSDELFSAIDTDDSGDLSSDEVSAFEEKMKTLFSRLHQMGSAEYQSVANAGYQTNDANLNLSA